MADETLQRSALDSWTDWCRLCWSPAERRIASYYRLHPEQVGSEPPRVRGSDGEAERGP